MKRRLLRLAERIDALSLRERVILFASLAFAILLIAYYAVLHPLFVKQVALRAQVSQQQNNLIGIDAELNAKTRAYAVDPDAPARAELAAIEAQTAKLGDSLRTMQKGLVAPERMVPLLETILKSNGRLRLVSMATLPVTSLNSASVKTGVAPAEPPKAGKPKKDVPAGSTASEEKPGLLYRHGVQLEVRGNYLDMIGYMSALESLPTQLFWGKAQLDAEEYPNARLQLTLYTLSLDPKWLKL